MKNKSFITILYLIILMISCISSSNLIPTGTPLPTIVPTSRAIQTTTSVPTYAYLPTITPLPSPTLFIITPSFSQSLTSQNSKTNYGNSLIVTIEEEKFYIEDTYTPVYRILLKFENSSKEEIKDASYYLVTYKGKDFKVFPDIYSFDVFWSTVLGESVEYQDRKVIIPTGESHFAINLYIWVNGNYPICTDGSLDKPLYLLMFSDLLATDSPLEVSNDLNKRIYEIPCKYP